MLYVNKTKHYKYKFKIIFITSKLLYFLAIEDKKTFVYILHSERPNVCLIGVIFVLFLLGWCV